MKEALFSKLASENWDFSRNLEQDTLFHCEQC